MIAGISPNLTVYLLTRSVPYESSTVIHVFTDREIADEACALYKEHRGEDYEYDVEEMTTDSGVPSPHRWFTTDIMIRASRQDDWFEYTSEHVEIGFTHEPIEDEVVVNLWDATVTNPDYVRDTPNARHVGTPGGRFLSDPTISVRATSLSREWTVQAACRAAHDKVVNIPKVGGALA